MSCCVFRLLVVDKDGKGSSQSMDARVLKKLLDESNSHAERVSTGTKFALAQWLNF